jgi:hypothetical protein
MSLGCPIFLSSSLAKFENNLSIPALHNELFVIELKLAPALVSGDILTRFAPLDATNILPIPIIFPLEIPKIGAFRCLYELLTALRLPYQTLPARARTGILSYTKSNLQEH